MGLDSLLASLNSGVSGVSGVQPSKHKGFTATPANSGGVSGVSVATPATPAKTKGYQPKPSQDKVCTPATPATPVKTKSETVSEILADILKEIGYETDLPEVLAWYANDHEDIARLPREQVVYLVQNYFNSHKQYRPELWPKSTVKCGTCTHFERIDHSHLGHCAKGEPEAIAGLWDTDRRYCEQYQVRPC